MKKKGEEESDGRIDCAILIADSFDKRFTPISIDIPRALCPLVNIPLIHYTMEFLVSNGIKKIFVICNAHAELIEEHLKKTYWYQLKGVEIKFVISKRADSVGEALREFNQIIEDFESDFLLITSDVVSNINLKEAFQLHHERRKKDKTIVMTSIFKKASPHHRSRAGEDTTIIAVEKNTQQLLYMDNSSSFELTLETNLWDKCDEIEIRYDLIDCRIDICSQQVLNLFQDEFDWKDLRQDFVSGILESEVFDHKIHIHAVETEYAARVRSLNTYAAVSQDVIHRWTYPLVPDNNISGFIWDTTTYTLSRPNIYKEKGILLLRSCQIGKGTVLARGTEVGEHSIIEQSVLGPDCKIGNNTEIRNSYLWGQVTVGNNCSITNSIICNRAIIKPNCVIKEGCLISFDVVIGPNITLDPESKITLHSFEEFDEFDTPTIDIDLGEEGVGNLWVFDERDETNSLNYNPHKLPLTGQSVLAEPDAGVFEVGPLNPIERVRQDIHDIVYNGINENKDAENLKLEIKGIKLSHNCEWSECAMAFVTCVLERSVGDLTKFLETIVQYHSLLTDYAPTCDDQVEVIFGIQEFCESPEGSRWIPRFRDLLYALYDKEYISEDAIITWYDEHQQDTDAKESECISQCANFIAWLQEASEESEEGEEGEEEDEEE